MRQLTVIRHKNSAIRFAKIKVYIEDEAGDLTYRGIRYRCLGALKNGETGTWAIDDRSRRVFVCTYRLSRAYCNDLYLLPAGEEDICLSGRTRFHIFTDNAFRFDGVVEPEILLNRKRSVRIGACVMAVAVAVGLLLGHLIANLRKPDPKTFTYEGMSITLTEAFAEESSVNPYIDVNFSSDYVVINVVLEPVAEDPSLEGITPVEYAEWLTHTLDGPSTDTEIHSEDGQTWFTYQKPRQKGGNMSYSVYVYVTDEVCCFLRIYTPAENMLLYRDDIREWAGSVTFTDE